MKDKYSYRNERDDYETLEPEDEVRQEPKTRNGIICNHALVNIRIAPKPDKAAILTTVPNNTTVDIVGEVPNYYQIVLGEYPGRVLYVSKEFCKEV